MNQSVSQPNQRLRPAPPKLEAVLDLVNLVFPRSKLKDLSEIEHRSAVHIHEQLLEQFAVQLPSFSLHIWQTAAESPLRRVFIDASTPEQAQRKIKAVLKKSGQGWTNLLASDLGDQALDGVYGSAIRKAWREYEFIRQARKNLLWLMDCVRSMRAPAQDIFSMPASIGVRLDNEGVVKIDPDRFAQAVDAVDATRIHECEGCERIFWAGRADATCCSSKCHTNVRNQIFRYLSKLGFRPGLRLTKKEKLKRDAAVATWRAQRKENDPYRDL